MTVPSSRRPALALGFAGRDLAGWKDVVASALGADFELRYSDHWGGDYWSLDLPDGRVKLVANFIDTIDGDLLIHDRPDLSVFVDSVGLRDEQRAALVALGAEVLPPHSI